ncbi:MULTISPECIES: hypothetical protein [Pantoea]|jgi:hypothetical protein|uniref:Uncharacterized protein n=1 Tax=Pantoea brenneri TaxID=472694 RepID=A0A7Y6TTJ8_9GAMM|nr:MULTISPECIES: hypothetical protein [Pantoea]MBZ6396985.1 hypothetical protein [Pantoea sp.]MBZ6440264.1 hypothetical protein [Pantoea sp.]NUY43471.1 hypothetical protein [Pantoea brenneri]NUY50963.1 hypothetical protein [Pantoea brenneri]NUY61306.1 hypothetical protein [Pantoea brenneri]
MNIHPPFHIGQRVRMSAFGYSVLRLDSADAFEASKNLVITYIKNIGHPDAPIWDVDVDNPLISMFLLEASMLEARE